MPRFEYVQILIESICEAINKKCVSSGCRCTAYLVVGLDKTQAPPTRLEYHLSLAGKFAENILFEAVTSICNTIIMFGAVQN